MLRLVAVLSCVAMLGACGDDPAVNTACDDNPCANGGTCSIAGTSGFACACADGFTGDTCEGTDQPATCDPNPCLNGGTCAANDDGTVSCTCADGWEGDTCETEVTNPDPCDPNPCLNGGTCVGNDDGTATCNCVSGFLGDTCEVPPPADPCDPNPCLNGGSCAADGENVTCTCIDGYTGDTCEVAPPADPCDPNPCLNGGTCAADGENASCTCAAGFHGDLCEKTACDFHCEGLVGAACDSPELPTEAACGALCGQLTADPGCGDYFNAVVTCMGDNNSWICVPSDPTDPASPTTFAPGKVECQQPFSAWFQCTQMVEPCTSYCDAAAANCTGDDEIDFSDAGCVATCLGWAPGEQGDTTGATLACRAYHVAAAADDAALHCPHASPEGGGVCVPTTCESYCATVDANCADENAIDFGDASCLDACDSWDAGEVDDTDGDSAACRLYHAEAAADDPALHCPHASPDGGGVCVATACDIYCDTVDANCTDEDAIDFGDAGCQAACGKWKSGNEDDTEGDTLGCRQYHADAAAGDAALHCPHASPEGGGVCIDPPQLCEVEGGLCDVGTPTTNGLICVTGWGGQGMCRKACSGEVDCLEGETCLFVGFEPEGFCALTACGGLFTDDCGPGASCIHFGGEGQCQAAGSVPEGAPCAGTPECQMQLLCVGSVCESPACSTDGIKTCPEENQICDAYSYGPGLPSDVGECIIPCVSFTEDPLCAENEWCMPMWFDAANGQCLEVAEGGGLAEGEVCGQAAGGAECAPNLICVGTCEVLCKAGAGIGELGGCGEAQACAGLSAGDPPQALDIGMCNDVCDFHGGLACPAETDFCAPGELIGESNDSCLTKAPFYGMEYGEACTPDQEFNFCADGAFCFNGACTKACFVSEGDFDAPDHPDCAVVAGSVCTNVGFNGGFGLCQ